MLLNAAKCQGYGFYCFWVIKGKPIGGDKTNPTPRLGLMIRIFRALSKFLLYGFHTLFGW